MRALLCLDLINELIHPDGKLAGKGYAAFASEHSVLDRVARIQDQFRQLGHMVIHTRVGFSEGYPELFASSPLFKDAAKNKALLLGTWATDLHEAVAKKGSEPTLTKHRVSPFYRTRLDLILRTQNITELYICGVASNLAVEQAAREGHDRDYKVTVISDACIAADQETHQRAMASMAPIATVAEFGKIAPKLTTA